MREFCRVAGDISPTSDSDINFEVWMPTGISWRLTTPARRRQPGSARYRWGAIAALTTRPTPYGHREVLIRGYVDEVAISCAAEVDHFGVTTR